jgi:hypothetical protein
MYSVSVHFYVFANSIFIHQNMSPHPIMRSSEMGQEVKTKTEIPQRVDLNNLDGL